MVIATHEQARQPFLAPPQHADDLTVFLGDEDQRGSDHLRDGLPVGRLGRPRMPEGAEQLAQLFGRGEGEVEPAVGVRDEPADAFRIRFEIGSDGEHLCALPMWLAVQADRIALSQ